MSQDIVRRLLTLMVLFSCMNCLSARGLFAPKITL